MIIEFIVAGLIIAAAVLLFVRSIKKKSSGCCNCSGCSSSCGAAKRK